MKARFTVCLIVAMFSSTSIIGGALAGDTRSGFDCADCTKKTNPVETMPDRKAVTDLKKAVAVPIDIASKTDLALTKKEISRSPAVVDEDKVDVKKSSKESYQGAFCMQFEQAQDTIDVETLIEEMHGCPYATNFKEFWSTPACHAPLKNDTNVPIIFNTASNPVKNEEFPIVVHDYLIDEKKDFETWLKIINTKTNDGYTFLDYLQYNLDRGFYSAKKDKDAALRIVTYICKNGGVYSKLKDSSKCP
jgi:hypothetical protein